MSIKSMVDNWLNGKRKEGKDEQSVPDFPSSTYQDMLDMSDTDEEEAKKWEAFSRHVSDRCKNITVGEGGTGCSHGRRWILDDYERLFRLIVELEDVSLSSLSVGMDRSVGSILSRLDALRLSKWIFGSPYQTGNMRMAYAMRHSSPEKTLQWQDKVLVVRFHLKVCGVPVNLSPLAVKTGLGVMSDDRKWLILNSKIAGKPFIKGKLESK